MGCVYRGEKGREKEREGKGREGERQKGREREARDWEVSEREPDFFLSKLTVIKVLPSLSRPPTWPY